MTNVKVTLPKEVAEAIERYRIRGASNKSIVSDVVNDFADDSLISFDLDELLIALVNGYEVEKSPEEKVREYYEGFSIGTTSRIAIKQTLNLLGIKIKEVNA